MSSFDDIIRQKLSGHKSPVPEGAWDKIRPPHRKRKRLFWYWGLGALLIAGVGIPGIRHWQLLQVHSLAKLAEADKPAVNHASQSKISSAQPVDAAGSNKSASSGAIKMPAENKEHTNVAYITLASTPAGPEAAVASDFNQKARHGHMDGKANRRMHSPVAEEWFDATIREEANTNRTVVAAKVATATSNATAFVLSTTGSVGESDNEEIAVAATTKQPDVVLNDVLDQDKAKSKNAISDVQPDKVAMINDSAAVAKPLVISTSANAADNRKKPAPAGLFAELSVAPFFPVQQNDANTSFSRTIITNGTRSEFTASQFSRQLSTAVGLQLALRKTIGSKWQIGMGVQYAVLKELVQLKGSETNTGYTIVSRLEQRNNLPVLVADSVETITKGSLQIEAVNSYRFISVPLFVQYRAGHLGSFDVAFTGGFYFNLQSNYSNSVNALVNRSAPVSSGGMGVDVFGGLRLSKLFAHRFNLFVEPAMRFNVTAPNIKNALVNAPVRQVSVAVGTAIKLK